MPAALPRRRAEVRLGAAGLLALAAAALTAAMPATAGAASAASATHGRTPLERTFRLEPAPQLDAADAVNLAAAPAGADPNAFNAAALNAAVNAPQGSLAHWRQVGPTGAIINSPDYATNEGRLPTTGIVLSIAADPRDRKGDTAYLGTGGGVFKTTDGGAHWTAMAIPAVPVGAVGIDPKNPDDVYAATGQGFQGGGEYGGLGLYWSHDAGTTWHRSATSVHGAGQEVAVAPDGTVFAATTGGLFRSTDHGAHFTDVALPTDPATNKPYTASPVGSWTSDVKINPADPKLVYAAVGYVAGNVTMSNGKGAAPGNGLYLSTDSGKPGTFHRVDVTSPTTGWEQEPTHSSDPIGRTRLAFAPDGSALYALVADAGHRSGGVAGPVDPAYSLLGLPPIPHPTSLNGVYLSLDGGQTWYLKADSATLTPAPGSTQGVLSAANLLGYDTGIQAWYNGWIAVDPADPTRVLLGEEEVYQSVTPMNVPGPAEFQSIDAYVSACGIVTVGVGTGSCPGPGPYGGQVTHPDQHGVAVVGFPEGGSRLWIGNDGGAFRQDHAAGAAFANGAWSSTAHLNQLLPYRAVEGPDGSVVAGLQDNGTTVYPAGSGNSYEVCGGDGSFVAIDPHNPKVFYCNANGSTEVTTDGGRTTTDISPSNVFPVFEPAASAMDPLDAKHLVLGDSDIVETVVGPDTGSSDWKTVFNIGTTKSGRSRVVEAVAVHGSTVYAAGCAACQSSVIASIDQTDRALATNVKPGCTPATGTGSCWHFAKLQGMPARQITALAIDPEDPRTVFLGTGVPSVIRVDFGGVSAARVLVSHDGGDTVSDISGNLPRGNVWDVMMAGGTLYAATDYGVFSSTPGSKVWKKVGVGMPVTRVFGLSRGGAKGRDIVAATYGRGVFVLGASLPAETAVEGGTAAPSSGTSATRGSVATGTLATTGLPGGLAATGLALLVAAAMLARRRRAMI